MGSTKHISQDTSEDEQSVSVVSAEDEAVFAPEETEEVHAALTTGETQSFWSRIKWGRVFLACVFAFLVVAAALFAWNRWYRFDDVADIQGTWRDVNSGATMEVNESYIKLADDAVYEYVLDTNDKRITYTFGNNEGFSSYRFSEDRKQLVLEDGAETDWGLVLHFHDDPGFAEGKLADGLTRLEKVSDEVPNIVPPGSNRPAGALVQSKPQQSSSASSSSASSASSSKDASSSSDKDKDEDEEEFADGYIVGPDRNARGYYDENWIFVPVVNGHYDDDGHWVDSDEEGYYDATGHWTTWDSDQTTESSDVTDAQGTGFYDQYGNWVDTSAWDSGALADGTDGTQDYSDAAADEAGNTSW